MKTEYTNVRFVPVKGREEKESRWACVFKDVNRHFGEIVTKESSKFLPNNGEEFSPEHLIEIFSFMKQLKG
jgi:hypothetical protein